MADNFYYVEGSTSVKNIIKDLTTEICGNAGTYKWTQVFPATLAEIGDKAIIKTTTTYGKTFYLKLERTAALVPTSAEQVLLDKYTYSKPYTPEEYTLLNRHIESIDLTSTDIALIKKATNTLTDVDITDLAYLRVIKNIKDDAEFALLQKSYRGESMTLDEKTALSNFSIKHVLTAQEIAAYNSFNTNRKLYSINIELALQKEFLGYKLIPSEEDILVNYRASIKLSDADQIQITILLSKLDNRNHMFFTIGTDIYQKQTGTDGGKPVFETDLVEDSCSVPSRLAWYKNLDTRVGSWLPVQYWINMTTDSINIIVKGDPSADNYPYDNYLCGYAYVGAIKPMEDGALIDDKYNFAVTTSSDIEPIYETKFGERTANGVTDVCMAGNKIGMPFQPHYPAFYTSNPFMDKCNTEGSRWNHKKHQFSDITLVHPVDMERGKMQNVLVGDASAIYDGDRLIYKKGEADEEMYKKFKVTAPYYFLNNSANTLYCLAIKCYKTSE